MAKAKVTNAEGKDLAVDASAEDLARISVTPGYIVRVAADANPGAHLAFVGADEDGFRRVGPAKGHHVAGATPEVLAKVLPKA